MVTQRIQAPLGSCTPSSIHTCSSITQLKTAAKREYTEWKQGAFQVTREQHASVSPALLTGLYLQAGGLGNAIQLSAQVEWICWAHSKSLLHKSLSRPSSWKWKLSAERLKRRWDKRQHGIEITGVWVTEGSIWKFYLQEIPVKYNLSAFRGILKFLHNWKLLLQLQWCDPIYFVSYFSCYLTDIMLKVIHWV